MEKKMKKPKFYTPREIARLRLIANYRETDNESSYYQFVIKLIKDSKLQAKSYGKMSRPYFLVSAEEIDRYNKEFYGG